MAVNHKHICNVTSDTVQRDPACMEIHRKAL